MADLTALEHSTLKVPYELLNKKFRCAQKTIDRECWRVRESVTTLDSLMQHTNTAVRVADVAPVVRSVIEKLQVLSARLATSLADESLMAQLLQRRLHHLAVGITGANNRTTLEQWRRQRIDRLIVDYLLRAGLYASADQLAQQSGLDYLCNRDIFIVAKAVEDSLIAHDVSKCLEWTHDNKSKLRRLKSRLEIAVRTQEFVEMIRRDERHLAVHYARKHFADADLWTPELQQAMALLALGADTNIAAYRALLDTSRWQQLVELFRAENFRLFQLSQPSVFSACLQCGLSALKTPQCLVEQQHPTDDAMVSSSSSSNNSHHRNNNNPCPLCRLDVHSLAVGLPYAHASQSRLVCAWSGEPLNEHNVPMMLPNGMIYGENSLPELERDGQIVCPKTGMMFAIDQVVRVYVM